MEALLDLWKSGGLMLWVLLVMSLIGAFCFMERLMYLRRCSIPRAKFMGGLLNLLVKGRLIEALTVCQENPGPVAAVIRAGLLSFKENNSKIAAAMREAALLQVPLLERRIAALNWIAKAAPLVGLLGTMIPLVRSFLIMKTQGPYLSSDLFIGEIGEALITTAAGILLSVMAISSWYVINSRVRSLTQDMELAAAELLQFRLQIEMKDFDGISDLKNDEK